MAVRGVPQRVRLSVFIIADSLAPHGPLLSCCNMLLVFSMLM